MPCTCLDHQDTAGSQLRQHKSKRQLTASLSRYHWKRPKLARSILDIRIAFSGKLIFDPASFSRLISVHDRTISQAIAASCYESSSQEI